MKVGFLTACLRGVDLPELFRWSAEHGFSALELCGGNFRDRDDLYVGGLLNVSRVTGKTAREVLAWTRETGVEVSCITQCTNMLDPDAEVRKRRSQDFKQVISAAGHLGVPTVSGFVGRDPTCDIRANVKQAARVFRPLLRYAANRGVRIAIENCPMPGWQFEGLAGNIAYSPFVWDQLYKVLPEDNFGLNYDPSHLYWLGIDYLGAVEEYADRIFHVHAKDTETLEDELAYRGSLLGGGWWRYRIPGMGELDWPGFLSRLYETGYDGAVSIEHEDPVWAGSEQKTKEGLIIGGKFLHQFVV